MSSFTLDDFRNFVIESLKLEGITPEMIAADEPLFGGSLGLDSVDALELIVAFEKRFGVRLRAQAIDASVFQTAGSLHRFLEQALAQSNRG